MTLYLRFGPSKVGRIRSLVEVGVKRHLGVEGYGGTEDISWAYGLAGTGPNRQPQVILGYAKHSQSSAASRYHQSISGKALLNLPRSEAVRTQQRR